MDISQGKLLLRWFGRFRCLDLHSDCTGEFGSCIFSHPWRRVRYANSGPTRG